MQVLDGKGSGSLWEVHKHRGQVDAQIETAFEKHSRGGRSFVWFNATYNMTAADTILAVRNTSPTRNLHISKITLNSDTVQQAVVHVTAGSAALAGTLVTGVNMNFTSGVVAEADARADETTNSAQGTVVAREELVAAQQKTIELEGALILGTNDAIGVDYPTDAAICHVCIYGYFELKEDDV